MNKILLAASLAAITLATPSHALFGIAGSYGYNGTSMSAKSESLAGAELPAYFQAANPAGGSLSYTRGSIDNLSQIGLKVWLEIPLLPVEFELATNVAFGSYASSLLFAPADGSAPQVIPVNVSAPIPFVSNDAGKSPYGSLLSDFTIRYPLLKFPPILENVKFWVGAGPTYALAMRVLDKSDLKSIYSAAGAYSPDKASTLFKDNLLTSTFGGHLATGVQVKLPVVPIGLFVDAKWYLHVATSDAVSSYPFAVNAGAGLAF